MIICLVLKGEVENGSSNFGLCLILFFLAARRGDEKCTVMYSRIFRDTTGCYISSWRRSDAATRRPRDAGDRWRGWAAGDQLAVGTVRWAALIGE